MVTAKESTHVIWLQHTYFCDDLFPDITPEQHILPPNNQIFPSFSNECRHSGAEAEDTDLPLSNKSQSLFQQT